MLQNPTTEIPTDDAATHSEELVSLVYSSAERGGRRQSGQRTI